MIQVPKAISERTTAAIAGDTASFGISFQWYRPRLYAHALRICGNTPLAQDAVQDTFIAAFTHLHSLREATSFYPWLKRILVNTCYQLLRKEKFTDFDEHITRKDFFIQESINAHFENISNQQRMYHALQFLSDELRACVMLRYFSAFNSYLEIAEVLGVPVGTVRSRLSAAREKMAAWYKENDDADDKALTESSRWSAYYYQHWNKIYDDMQTRNELFEHFLPSLDIRFTSGRKGKGRVILEKELSDDLFYGSRFQVRDVMSSGNISIIEGPNINHPDYPDRCAPQMALVLFRNEERAESIQIFDSPRSKASI